MSDVGMYGPAGPPGVPGYLSEDPRHISLLGVVQGIEEVRYISANLVRNAFAEYKRKELPYITVETLEKNHNALVSKMEESYNRLCERVRGLY